MCVSDTAYVRIYVTDVNDNAPAFLNSVYEVSVEEDQEVGFIIITVTANDEDEGESEGLLYSSLSFLLLLLLSFIHFFSLLISGCCRSFCF